MKIFQFHCLGGFNYCELLIIDMLCRYILAPFPGSIANFWHHWKYVSEILMEWIVAMKIQSTKNLILSNSSNAENPRKSVGVKICI